MMQSIWDADTAAQTTSASPQKPIPAQSGNLALNTDDFAGLEERIQRAVALVKTERAARTVAEQRAEKAESQLHQQSPVVQELQKEIAALKEEREQIRLRVEKLLQQLDALEL